MLLLIHSAYTRLKCRKTFYLNVTRLFIYQLVKENIDANPNATFIMFTNFSWQDCPSTRNSTGYKQSTINMVLLKLHVFLIFLSSVEAQYNAAAHAMQHWANVHQVLQELSVCFKYTSEHSNLVSSTLRKSGT